LSKGTCHLSWSVYMLGSSVALLLLCFYLSFYSSRDSPGSSFRSIWWVHAQATASSSTPDPGYAAGHYFCRTWNAHRLQPPRRRRRRRRNAHKENLQPSTVSSSHTYKWYNIRGKHAHGRRQSMRELLLLLLLLLVITTMCRRDG